MGFLIKEQNLYMEKDTKMAKGQSRQQCPFLGMSFLLKERPNECHISTGS